MWNKIKSPVFLMLSSIAVVVIDRIMMFFDYYLVYFGIHVVWVAPIMFIVGLIWLIVAIIKK